MDKTVQSRLRDILSYYSYGKHDLLDKDLTFLYNPDTKTLVLEDFFNYDLKNKVGICQELIVSVRDEIRSEMPEYYVYGLEGYDNHFFNPFGNENLQNLNHSFLGLVDREKQSKLFKPIERLDLLFREGVLIDPTYKNCSSLRKSGYEVKEYSIEGQSVGYPRNLILKNTAAVPIGIKNENLFSITSDFNSDFMLGLVVSNVKRHFFLRKHDSFWGHFNDKNYMDLIDLYFPNKKDPLYMLIQKFRETPIFQTDKLIDENCVYLD